MIYIRTSHSGYVTIHKNHRPPSKEWTLTEFDNRDGERVFEYRSQNPMSGSIVTFVEVKLQD